MSEAIFSKAPSAVTMDVVALLDYQDYVGWLMARIYEKQPMPRPKIQNQVPVVLGGSL